MPIYVGTQKIDVSGMDKVYVGTQLVYQKNAQVLTSITLSGQTTSLNRGASFSFGGTVTAHYSNGSTANVTSSTTFSGYNMSAAGTYTVTASYTENDVTKTATYQLTVNKAWSAVWTGSKTVSITYKTSSGTGTFYTTPNNDGYNVGNYRVTFTMSASGTESGFTYSTRYGVDGQTLEQSTTTKPSSPHRWNTTLSYSSSSKDMIKIYRTTGTNGGTSKYNLCAVTVKTDNTNNNLIFGLRATYNNVYQPGSNIKTSITVTKIEKYY